jgi:hypothetical protein
MRSPDPERETMPIAGGAGEAPVSNAWWRGWKRRPHRQHERTPAWSLYRRRDRSPASAIRADQDGEDYPRQDRRAELAGASGSLMAANLGDASSQTEEFRFRRRHLTRPVGLFSVSRTSRSPGRTRAARPASPSRRLRAIPKDNLMGQIDEGAQARGHVAASWIIEAISGIRGRPLAYNFNQTA